MLHHNFFSLIFIFLFFNMFSSKSFSNNNDLNHKIGIAIICYNRPNYLLRLIKTIEQNSESQSLPFYFSLDGGPEATQDENKKIINESTIKNKIIIKREKLWVCKKSD